MIYLGYPYKPLFCNFLQRWWFLQFHAACPDTTANSSFQNKNWYNEVTSYPLDLTWKFFLWNFFWEKSTFHFLNLSPALLSIGALNDPKRPRKGNNQSYRTDIYIILVNLRHVSRCLEWLDGIDPVSTPQRACMKKVIQCNCDDFGPI